MNTMSVNRLESGTATVKPSQMTDRLNSLVSPKPGRLIYILMAVLAAVALVISGYLAYVSLTSSTVAGCSGGYFDCESVMKSKWAKWFGVPVGLLAAMTYAAMLFSLAMNRFGPVVKRKFFCLATTTLCLSAGAAAVWFVYLQFFVLEHLCVYCLIAHSCGLLLTVAILFQHKFDFTTMIMPSAVALAGLAIMATGQWLSPEPKTYVVHEYTDQTVSTQEELDTDVFGAPGEENEGLFDGEFAPPVEELIPEQPADTEVTQNQTTSVAPFKTLSAAALFTGMLTYQPAQDSADQAAGSDKKKIDDDQKTETKPVRRLARFFWWKIQIRRQALAADWQSGCKIRFR